MENGKTKYERDYFRNPYRTTGGAILPDLLRPLPPLGPSFVDLCCEDKDVPHSDVVHSLLAFTFVPSWSL